MMFFKQLINTIAQALGNLKMLLVILFNYYEFYEDFVDMRKSMPRDKDKILMKPTNKKIEPDDLEFH